MRSTRGVYLKPNSIPPKPPAASCGGDGGSCSPLIFVQSAALSQNFLPAPATVCPTDLGSRNLVKLSLGSPVLMLKPEWPVLPTALVESDEHSLSIRPTTNAPEPLHQTQPRLSPRTTAVLQEVTPSQNTPRAYQPSREDAAPPRISNKSYHKLQVKVSTGQGGRDERPSKDQAPSTEGQQAWRIHGRRRCCLE